MTTLNINRTDLFIIRSMRFTALSTLVVLSLHSTLAVSADIDSGSKSTEYSSLHEFDLPAADLSETLLEFGLQCGCPVAVSYEQVKEKYSSPVIGRMTAEQALTRLLKRTGFTYKMVQGQIKIIPEEHSIEEPTKKKSELEDETGFEQILVRGIRASLSLAAEIKQHELSVVDAISAEDIGKFPDGNLAESIQRIPGASISRIDGEGSKVTVRGFTGNYNLVTFNGRTMPHISAPVDRIGDSRAFEFSSIASENIKAVKIYKTHHAELAAGGIGATIDIQSYQPLQTSGQRNYISIKGLWDSSQISDTSVTPEISALYSWIPTENFGVSVSGSLQERKSGSARAYVSAWQTEAWDDQSVARHSTPCADIEGNPETDNCYEFVNAPSAGQLYSLPNDLHYAVGESKRRRENIQIVFQYKAFEALTFSMDYAYFRNSREQDISEFLLRFTNNRSYLLFDNKNIRSPQQTIETHFGSDGQATGSDLGYATQLQSQENTSDSLGFKVEFQAHPDLNLVLDMHHSESESGPGDSPYGGWANLRFGANVVGTQKVDWRGSVPSTQITINDSPLEAYGSHDQVFDEQDIGSQVASSNFSLQKNRVDQVNLKGQWDSSIGNMVFGFDQTQRSNLTQFSEVFYVMGDWGITDPPEFPDNLLSPFNFASEFDELNSNDFFGQGFRADSTSLIAWAESSYPTSFDGDFRYNENLAIDRITKEDNSALFYQFDKHFDFNHWALDVRVGYRWIHTRVETRALINPPDQIVWFDNGDLKPVYSDAKQSVLEGHGFNRGLPNLDLKLNLDMPFGQSLVARSSYYKSMARPEYSEMSPEIASFVFSGVKVDNQVNAFASAGNPQLEPLMAENIDVSLEWYFDQGNYISIAYFDKKIDNFIGSKVELQSVYDLRDATAGPRAEAAQAAIEQSPDYDGNISETELFNQIAAVENNDFNPTPNDNSYYGNTYDIYPDSSDPLFNFAVLRPANEKAARIRGVEYAAQWLWAEPGLGLALNYTSVEGDVGFDSLAHPLSRQFALLGLSDTLNAMVFYEKGKIQCRLAYHWRDHYLESLAEEPSYVEAYEQLDFLFAYSLGNKLVVSFEALNITGEDKRSHGRSELQLKEYEQLDPRYYLGFRYQF